MINFQDSPDIDSFHWDTTGWQPQPTTDGSRAWINPHGDMAVQTFADDVPTGLPANWRDPAALRAHVRAHPAPALAVISADVFHVAGISLAQFLQKEYLPATARGYLYSGMLTLPFRAFYCNVFFICPARGDDDTRESVLLASGQIQPPDQDVLPENDAAGDPETSPRHGPPPLLGAEDEKFDPLFPYHPVTRLHAYLRAFRESLKVDLTAAAHRPFGD